MSTDTIETKRLLAQLAEIAPDGAIRRRAGLLQARLKLRPMKEILEHVPGDGYREKAKRIGIARQTIYQWLDGTMRPSRKRARQLARITGVPADEICPF
jgi:transcriptional regulator with XRE-family HTH domain